MDWSNCCLDLSCQHFFLMVRLDVEVLIEQGAKQPVSYIFGESMGCPCIGS